MINRQKSITKTRHTKTKHNSISVLSYNVSWESMSGKDKNWYLCSNNNNSINKNYVSVCVSNIGKVINENPTDFITLQEADNYKKLLNECPQLKKMKYKIHNSGLETCVTFWNNKYKILSSVEGEFENERPWLAILFTNGLCLINVHFGHYNRIEEYNKINKMLNTINTKLNCTIKRYIIAGDFNYDIKNIGKKKGIINIHNNKFYYHLKHILTCCLLRIKHYDHIIDSYKPPKDIYIPNVEYMASDHKPIIALLHKD